MLNENYINYKKGKIFLNTCIENNLKNFINKARLIHDDFYSYDKSKYKRAKTNLIITCPKHGDFDQQPTNHLRKTVFDNPLGKVVPKCT